MVFFNPFIKKQLHNQSFALISIKMRSKKKLALVPLTEVGLLLRDLTWALVERQL